MTQHSTAAAAAAAGAGGSLTSTAACTGTNPVAQAAASADVARRTRLMGRGSGAGAQLRGTVWGSSPCCSAWQIWAASAARQGKARQGKAGDEHATTVGWVVGALPQQHFIHSPSLG